MDVLSDIRSIVRDDKRHNIKIYVESGSLTVYLDDDPANLYQEEYLIPIKYDVDLGCCIIPFHEFSNIYHSNSNLAGIDVEEIELIHNIMYYMNNHGEEIEKLIKEFAWSNRETR